MEENELAGGHIQDTRDKNFRMESAPCTGSPLLEYYDILSPDSSDYHYQYAPEKFEQLLLARDVTPSSRATSPISTQFKRMREIDDFEVRQHESSIRPMNGCQEIDVYTEIQILVGLEVMRTRYVLCDDVS
jgi:hypothetical protein